MDARDGITVAHFGAGPDNSVQLLLHFGIATLDRVEVKFFNILSLDHTGGCASAHSDTIRRAADLYDHHPAAGFLLFDMPGVYLTHSACEHYRLYPFPPVAVRQSKSK
jgi:hypothetical protein